MSRTKGTKNKHTRLDKGIPKAQFCPKGHDTFVTGRYAGKQCIKCVLEKSKDYQAEKREKIRNGTHVVKHRNKFCINGHDTALCGRNKNGQCLECHKEQKEHRRMADKKHRQKRERLVIAFKNKPCADCQGWFDPCQMDFDHRPGEVKLFGIREGITRTDLKTFLQEIEKCEVVCANCHRLRTYKRMKQKIKSS